MNARGLLAALVLVTTFFAVAPAARADGADVARGAVGFVSDRSVYVSIGSEAGVEVGAEALVYRDGRRVGSLRVEAVSSRSAVATTISIDGAIEAGDVVVVRISRRVAAPLAAAPAPARGAAAPAPSSAPAPATGGRAPAPSTATAVATTRPAATTRTAAFAPSAPTAGAVEELWLRIETAPIAKVPFRRGGAVVAPGGAAGGGPRAATRTAAVAGAAGAPAANHVHGSITIGWVGSFDRPQGGAPAYDYQAPRGSANVTVDRLGGEELTLRFRGDARGIIQSQDRYDRAGATLDRRIYLGELSLTWLPSAAPVRVSVGRTFAADAAQAGLVDGARAGARLGPLEVGGFGGLDAAPDLSDRGRLKLGAYATVRVAPLESVRYDGAAALVRTTEGGHLDRQLIAVDQRLVLVPWLTVFNLDEIDLTGGTPNPEGRPSVDLTDVYAGVRVRPARFLDLGVAYDRRRPFFGAREVDALAPATVDLLDPGPWTTLRTDARVDLPLRCYVRGSWDRRIGAGGGTSTGGEAGCDAVCGEPLRLAGGGSTTTSRYLSGVSFFGRAGAALGEDVDLTVSYTITLDRYEAAGGLAAPGDRVTRHEPRVELEWFISRSLLLSAEAGYELGDEARRALASVALTYRF